MSELLLQVLIVVAFGAWGEGQKPESAGREARGGGRLGAMALMVWSRSLCGRL
jgi:hypothetical protein